MTKGRNVRAVVFIDGNMLGELIAKAAANRDGRFAISKGAIVVMVRDTPPSGP